jgi:small subunit ribosomal protein S16
MLMIRFQRIGRKNDAAFRIAVLPKTSGPKAGKYVELVGNYNPKTKAASINEVSIKSWISKGAQLSPSVHNLLVSKGILEGKKINVLPKKTFPVKEAVVEEAPAAAAPVAEAAPEVPTEEVAASAEETPVVEEAAPVAEETPEASVEEPVLAAE